MAPLPSVTPVQVETTTFPPTAKPPGSANTLFLGGAGVRGLPIEGKFVKFTVIGVYLEDNAVPVLAVKWKGKTAQELADSVEFFKDVVTGPFEKLTQVTFIQHLTGRQYSEKVAENCIASRKSASRKSAGFYSGEEAKAIETFLEVFKDQTFPPGSSVSFTQSPPHGSLTISFSKDGSIPQVGNEVMENKLLGEAILESIIGKHGVSPAARQSLAERLSDLLIEKPELLGVGKATNQVEVGATDQRREMKKWFSLAMLCPLKMRKVVSCLLSCHGLFCLM